MPSQTHQFQTLKRVHVVTALLLKAPTGEGIDAGFGEAGTGICSRGRALKPPKPLGFYRSG